MHSFWLGLFSSPQIAREHGIRFFETSAKANINIEKAFLTLAEDILRKVCAQCLTWNMCSVIYLFIYFFH